MPRSKTGPSNSGSKWWKNDNVYSFFVDEDQKEKNYLVTIMKKLSTKGHDTKNAWYNWSNFRMPHHSEPTLFSLIRCESVFITMYPYRDSGQFSDASHRVFYYVTVHGYTHIVIRVNFLMQVNGFLYYVTIHGCTNIVMWVFSDASHRVFFTT